MSTPIPPDFPFVFSDPSAPPTAAAQRRNASALVKSKHWQGVNNAMNYLYGRRKRVYPAMEMHGILGNDLESVPFQHIYIEPDVDEVVAYIRALAPTNDYYFGLDLGGATRWFFFPSDSGVQTVSGVIATAGAGWADLTGHEDPAFPGDQVQILSIALKDRQVESY